MNRGPSRLLLVSLLAAVLPACAIEQDLAPRAIAPGAARQVAAEAVPTEEPSDDEPPTEPPTEAPTEVETEEPAEPPLEAAEEPVTNARPAVRDDSFTTLEDTPVVLAVLANDRDVDGDGLVARLGTTPRLGVVSVDRAGIRYAPHKDVNGVDRFEYRVSDGRGGLATGTVTVTITPVNDAPVANDDRVATIEEAPVRIDVLANDTDVDGDPLEVTAVGTPALGTAQVVDGEIAYVPGLDAVGSDRFTYTVSDPSGETSTATVIVDIEGENDAPVAVDDEVGTREDRPVTIDALANDTDVDGDVLAVAGVGSAALGTVTIVAGQLVYTPRPDVFGTDSFTYTVRDPAGATDEGTVTVVIAPVNDAPVAVDDALTVAEGSGATAVDVLANDRDVEGDQLRVTSVGQPDDLGTVTLADGVVSFQPLPGRSGTTTFTYRVSDGRLSDVGQVTVTVRPAPPPVNQVPTAVADGPYLVDADDEVTIVDLLDNDADPENAPLAIELVAPPANGTVVLIDPTTVKYTNTSGGAGPGDDSFTYRANDGTSASPPVTVTLKINRPPTPMDDALHVVSEASTRSVSFNVLTGVVEAADCCVGSDSWTGGADTDPDVGDVLTFVGPLAPGGLPTDILSLTCDAAGDRTVEFEDCAVITSPDPYEFVYTVKDLRGLTATATVALTAEESCPIIIL